MKRLACVLLGVTIGYFAFSSGTGCLAKYHRLSLSELEPSIGGVADYCIDQTNCNHACEKDPNNDICYECKDGTPFMHCKYHQGPNECTETFDNSNLQWCGTKVAGTWDAGTQKCDPCDNQLTDRCRTIPNEVDGISCGT